ncbi:MAG: ATP-grasp domain-containing protein [Calditrichia bacterium]
MRIAVVYSSKDGLLKEFQERYGKNIRIPEDFLAEGDSEETIKAVCNAIASHNHHVIKIEADSKAYEHLKLHHPDLVFNMAEGLFGDFRESYIPMLCERLGIHYTGSDPLTLGICLNKARTKEILSHYLIPNAPFQLIYPGRMIELDNLDFPLIIKPLHEGSSKGIYNNSVVENKAQAIKKITEIVRTYNQPVLVEKYLPGDEFTVSVWGNGDDVEVLPIVRMNFGKLPENAYPIYSYEAKWIWDMPESPLEIFECPAILDPVTEERIKDVVLDAYTVLGIRDWARIDVRMDENGLPNIIEINPLPGILPNPEDNSCFPKAARTAGYTYVEMINKVIKIAAKRIGMKMYAD